MPHPSAAAPHDRPLGAAPGDILGGRYELQRLLGVGGTGAVFEAKHTTIGRVVALKLLLPEIAANPTVARRFLQEAQTANAVRHRNIVEVIDFGDDHGRLFMVMEFLQGESLAATLKREAPMRPGAILALLDPIFAGLHFAHLQGVVHRDVKPQNIFIVHEPDGARVPKLLDFGIAKRLVQGDTQLTGTGMILGTPAYMAPEQARGARDVTPAADQYALGAILYQALSGQIPHQAETFPAMLIAIVSGPPPPTSAPCAPTSTPPSRPSSCARCTPTPTRVSPPSRPPARRPAPLGRRPHRRRPHRRRPRPPRRARLAAPRGAHTPRRHAAPPEAVHALSVGPAHIASAPSPAPAAPARMPRLAAAVAAVAALTATAALALVLRPAPRPAAAPPAPPAVTPSAVTPPAPVTPRPAPPAGVAAPVPVTFRVDVHPPTAEIFLDDVLLGRGHAEVLRPRDGARRQLRLAAPGYATVTEVLVADADARVSRMLAPLSRPTPLARMAPRPGSSAAPDAPTAPTPRRPEGPSPHRPAIDRDNPFR
jgi:serine/threonine protein kinase